MKKVIFTATLIALTLPLLFTVKDKSSDTSSITTSEIEKPVEKMERKTPQEKISFYQPNYEDGNIQIPEHLRPIFNKNLSNKERIGIVKKLSKDLSDEERDALYSYLGNDENTRFTLWMKDEIMCKLEEQLVRPSEYEQALMGIIQDHNIDGNLRGYAVQHLRSAWRVKGVDKKYVESALEESLKDRDSDVSGTALLALNKIYSETGHTANLASIHEAAENLALDNSAHMPSRLTALSVILQNSSTITDQIRILCQEITADSSSYDKSFQLVASKLLSK